jgi:hypothetical protein
MALLPFERETTIGWDKSTTKCQLITFDQSLDRKLMGYCKKFPDKFKMVSEQILDGICEGHEFEFPKNLITIRQPTKKKKEMTEEQKAAASKRLEKARKAKTKEKEKKNKE